MTCRPVKGVLGREPCKCLSAVHGWHSPFWLRDPPHQCVDAGSTIFCQDTLRRGRGELTGAPWTASASQSAVPVRRSPLHPVRRDLANGLGQRPAVLALRLLEQSTHIGQARARGSAGADRPAILSWTLSRTAAQCRTSATRPSQRIEISCSQPSADPAATHITAIALNTTTVCTGATGKKASARTLLSSWAVYASNGISTLNTTGRCRQNRR